VEPLSSCKPGGGDERHVLKNKNKNATKLPICKALSLHATIIQKDASIAIQGEPRTFSCTVFCGGAAKFLQHLFHTVFMYTHTDGLSGGGGG